MRICNQLNTQLWHLKSQTSVGEISAVRVLHSNEVSTIPRSNFTIWPGWDTGLPSIVIGRFLHCVNLLIVRETLFGPEPCTRRVLSQYPVSTPPVLWCVVCTRLTLMPILKCITHQNFHIIVLISYTLMYVFTSQAEWKSRDFTK